MADSLLDQLALGTQRYLRVIDLLQALVEGPEQSAVTLPDGDQVNTYRESLRRYRLAAESIPDLPGDLASAAAGKGASLVAYDFGLTLQQYLPTSSLYGLLSTDYFRVDGLQMQLGGFYSGSHNGGGQLVYRADMPRSKADGVTVFDPENIGSLDASNIGNFHDGRQGSGTGDGCWVRLAHGPFSVFDAGAVGDNDGTHGSGTDDTQAINRAIAAVAANGGGTISVPRANYRISVSPGAILVSLQSNITLAAEPGATFVMDGNGEDSYQILKIGDNANIEVRNLALVGDRTVHTGTTGEGGMGIDMRGAQNIRLVNLHISDCWGDGIYIGGASGNRQCKDVTIEDTVVDNCRRQGVSVISATGLRIANSVLKNTNGTAPGAGIDFEPNNSGQRFEDICLQNVRTENNAGGGIIAFMANFRDTTPPVSIDIYNHVSINDSVGFSIGGLYYRVSGHINTHNPVWNSTAEGGFRCHKWGSDNLVVNVVRPTCIDLNTSGSTDAALASAFSIFNTTGDPNNDPIGNVHITEPRVIDKSGHRAINLIYFSRNGGSNPSTRGALTLLDPLHVDISGDLFSFGGPFASGHPLRVTDRAGLLARNISATTSLQPNLGEYAKTFTSDGLAANANLYLGALNYYYDDELSVTCTTGQLGANTLRVVADQFQSGQRIYPGGYTRIETNELGARVALKPVSGGFYVVSQHGNWSGQ